MFNARPTIQQACQHRSAQFTFYRQHIGRVQAGKIGDKVGQASGKSPPKRAEIGKNMTKIWPKLALGGGDGTTICKGVRKQLGTTVHQLASLQISTKLNRQAKIMAYLCSQGRPSPSKAWASYATWYMLCKCPTTWNTCARKGTGSGPARSA